MDRPENPKIELEAAQIAIEWKNLFATELQALARQLAEGCEFVTAEHLRRALPTVTANLVQAVRTHSSPSANVQRRIA